MTGAEPWDLTRRNVLKGLGATAALAGLGPLVGRGAPAGPDRGPGGPQGDRTMTLRNSRIALSLSLVGGRILSRTYSNLSTGETFAPPAGDAALEFAGGEVVSLPGAGTAEVTAFTGDRIELLYPCGEVDIRVSYFLPAAGSYLRKSISLRSRGGPRRLLRADLEDWTGVRRAWTSTKSDFLRFGSHPIRCGTAFAGVEFVAASNEFGPDGFILRSRPGGVEVAGDWLALNSTVLGVAEEGRVREAFLAYLEDVRRKPARLVACYNSWWTLPAVVTHEENLALTRTLADAFHGRHGTFFDLVTTDMGWSDPRSIWQVDIRQLPGGFADVRGIVEAAGGRIGLWLSPGELYRQACDYGWMERSGFFVVRDGGEPLGVSLADPRFTAETRAQLQRLVRENNLGHLKYDGFLAEERRGHDSLLPGEDSVEAIARHSLELLEVARTANPDLVTEETFFNRVRNYASPWIIKYSDTVYGNAGDDCPRGMNPAPEYRESHTNAREYYIQASLDDLWLPQNAVHYFDIVHCDGPEGFPNHAAMAIGRGRFFLSTYLNPKFMSDDDWRVYAGLLRWARGNQDILRNTTAIPGRVEQGECYGYAHWSGRRGIVAVRNPSNASCTFPLDLQAAGAPAELSGAVCYVQFPYRKGIARGAGATSVLPLRLGPWELLFLEIVPERDLAEAVAIGARWYHEAQGTRIVADPGSGQVTWLEPNAGQRVVSAVIRPSADPSGSVLRLSGRRVPGQEELDAGSGAVPTTAFELECQATIPAGAGSARMLLLVEFRGRKYLPSRCTATVDGLPVDLVAHSSEYGLGDYMDLDHAQFRNAREHESEWCWYECPLPSGPSRVGFSGLAGSESPHIGLWVWSEERLESLAQALPAACSAPAMPQVRADIERKGLCIRPSSAIAG